MPHTTRRIRLIPALDENERAVAFAQTTVGKLAQCALAAPLLLYLVPGAWWPTTLAIAVIALVPTRRKLVVAGATLCFAFAFRPPNFELVINVARAGGIMAQALAWWPAFVAVVLAVCALWIVVAKKLRAADAPIVGRHPFAVLMVAYVAALSVASLAPMPNVVRALVWIFVIVWGRYLWFLAYSLHHRDSSPLDVFRYLPFWGSTQTPYPKASSFVDRLEVKDERDAAIWRFKGLKLLAWAALLAFTLALFDRLVANMPSPSTAFVPASFAGFGVPMLDDAIDAAAAGKHLGPALTWACVIANFVRNVLQISVTGHIFIGACRMSGYRALRNTYKPLYASNIAEFYNRIYFYFKELLVDFFFYPSYFRFFKKHPRLRMFTATMAAACFGNVLYHYVQHVEDFVGSTPWRALWDFQVYIFYGVVLGLAIAVSQARRVGKRERPKRRILPTVGVLLFYCVIMIFDFTRGDVTLVDTFRFASGLLLP